MSEARDMIRIMTAAVAALIFTYASLVAVANPAGASAPVSVAADRFGA